jgi:transcriptional antiterminator RfaH
MAYRLLNLRPQRGTTTHRTPALHRDITVEDLQRNWFVVYSNPHKEEQAQFHLALKGVKSFFPKLYIPAARENKGRICPLFPNYLFVRIHVETESHRIVWTPGVKKIVSFGAEPIPIDDRVIQFLRQQADDTGVIRAHSKLTLGQEVEISGGPFDGLIGIIQAPPDNKGRVQILLKLLSRQVSVKFGVEFIKGGRASWAPVSAADIGPRQPSC